MRALFYTLNKSDKETQILYDPSYIWNINLKGKKNELTDLEYRLVVARGGWWWVGNIHG